MLKKVDGENKVMGPNVCGIDRKSKPFNPNFLVITTIQITCALISLIRLFGKFYSDF